MLAWEHVLSNLEHLQREILSHLEDRQIVVFRSYPRGPELGADAVYWDNESHPDYRDFVAAAQAAGRRLSVLVELRLGRHMAGVTAGPDAVHLAAAVLRLPELHLSGLFVRDPCDSEVDAAEQGRALQSAVSMSQHTWQMMQRRQSPGSGRAIHTTDSGTLAPLSLVCGRLPVPLLSEFHGAAVCNPWPVSASISKADIDNRPSTYSISALVIARPTLETCVIARFRPGDGRKVKYRVLSPIGAEVRDCWDHYLTLSVDGPALDLKIGDEVLLSTEFPPD
mgnify:CR=1 FL=1